MVLGAVLLVAVVVGALGGTWDFNSTHFKVQYVFLPGPLHQGDVYEFTGQIDGDSGSVRAHSLVSTALDHNLTFTKEIDTDNFEYHDFTATINGTAYTGKVVLVHVPGHAPYAKSVDYQKDSKSAYMLTYVPPPQCSDQFDKSACDAVSKCTWCISKDQHHSLCFEKSNKPDLSEWSCDAASFVLPLPSPPSLPSSIAV